MINWIMTGIGLILLVAYYQLLGSSFFIGIKIKRNRFAFNLISGFILTWALGWITGFPCELYSTSWDFFAIIFTIALIGAAVIALIIQSKYSERFNFFLKKDIQEKIKTIGKHFLHNLSEYWFVYLFVIIFSVLSITNMQPYTLNNYNDDHYIVRVLHLYKSTALFNEDYYTGNLLQNTGMFSYALQQGQRMFNTYELVYSYIGSLLHINLIFFCRVTMTAHNYLIVFMLYTLFASIFLRAKYAQFGILCFSILFIPAGYLAKANIPIRVRMWENWRFQTAMYMGSSIVRCCSLPLYFYFLYISKCYSNRRINIFILILALSLLSFQTTAISYFLLFIPIFILFICLQKIWENYDMTKTMNIKILIYIITMIIVLVLTSNFFIKSIEFNIPAKYNIITHVSLNYSLFERVIAEYKKYYVDAFTFDYFAKYSSIALILLFIFIKNYKERIILVCCLFVYLFFALKQKNYFLSLISLDNGGSAYCSARLLTSMQILMISIWGILLIKIISFVPYSYFVKVILSVSMFLCTITYLVKNINSIESYNGIGDAITKEGYSCKPLCTNQSMLPSVFYEIGNYFNKNVNNSSLLYTEEYFKLDGTQYGNMGFLLASKNIKLLPLVYKEYDYSKEKSLNIYHGYYALTAFSSGKYAPSLKNNYSQIIPYVKKGEIEYFFTTRKNIKNILQYNKWKVVLEKKNYWLLKSPY